MFCRRSSRTTSYVYRNDICDARVLSKVIENYPMPRRAAFGPPSLSPCGHIGGWVSRTRSSPQRSETQKCYKKPRVTNRYLTLQTVIFSEKPNLVYNYKLFLVFKLFYFQTVLNVSFVNQRHKIVS
jgi:hypothetical protein